MAIQTNTTSDELFTLFSERATPLGSNVVRVADSVELMPVVKAIADAAGVDAISVSRPVSDNAPVLLTQLATAGVRAEVIQDRNGARDKAVGISLAFRGFAETGSVFLDERHIQDRATSLMTLHNVVLIRIADLLPSLDSVPELLREIATRGPGGYASLVTGPSRTADIEMSLTVGVQGPNQISMIFVDHLT